MRISVMLCLAFLGIVGAKSVRADTPSWSVAANAAAEATVRDQAVPTSAIDLELSADASTRDMHPLVPTVEAGGSLWLATGGDAPGVGASSSVYGEAGPWEIWPDDELDFMFSLPGFHGSHQLDWNAEPAWNQRRELWRRPYTREQAAFGFHVLGGGTSAWRAQLGEVEVRSGNVRQRDSGTLRTQRLSGFTFGVLRAEARDASPEKLRFHLIIVHVDGTKDELREASVGNISFAEVLNLRPISLLPIFIDGNIGVGGTGEQSVNGEEIGTSNLPGIVETVYGARIHGRHGAYGAEVGIRREIYLTFDMQLALDQRLEGRIDWAGTNDSLALSGFVARTLVWIGGDDPNEREQDVTGGVNVAWRHRLGPYVELGLDVDVARSFYASLEGALTPRPALATRVGASLQTRFGSDR